MYKVKSPELKKIAVLSLKYSQIVERWSIILRTPFELLIFVEYGPVCIWETGAYSTHFCKMGHFPKYGPPILKTFH